MFLKLSAIFLLLAAIDAAKVGKRFHKNRDISMTNLNKNDFVNQFGRKSVLFVCYGSQDESSISYRVSGCSGIIRRQIYCCQNANAFASKRDCVDMMYEESEELCNDESPKPEPEDEDDGEEEEVGEGEEGEGEEEEGGEDGEDEEGENEDETEGDEGEEGEGPESDEEDDNENEEDNEDDEGGTPNETEEDEEEEPQEDEEEGPQGEEEDEEGDEEGDEEEQPGNPNNLDMDFMKSSKSTLNANDAQKTASTKPNVKKQTAKSK